MFGPRSTFFRYTLAIVAVAMAILLRQLLEPWLSDGSLLVFFSAAILVSSLAAGTGPGMAATAACLLVGLGLRASVEGHDFLYSPQVLLFLSLSACILYIGHVKVRSRERNLAALRALEQREGELHTVIEALPVGIWFVDQQGRVLSVNQAGRDIWEGARYVGKEGYGEYKMWVPGGDRLKPEDYPGARALRGETVLREPVEIETFTGKRRHVVNSAVPLRVGDGPVIGSVVLTEDMTDRQRSIEELQRARDQAEAANLAKDRFLAVLSHELRTPLTPVLMLAESLESHPSLPSSIRLDASLIPRHASLEARLIDDLLDLTRIEKGKLRLERRPVDLHEIAQTAVEMIRPQARSKNVELGVALEAARPYVSVDRARIKQVILNLLGNALKFTPSGGRITVRSETRDETTWVSVTDTGIGIEPDALATIFDAFEQAGAVRRRFGGLGLGLAISRSLVELHGGSIRASSPGVGKGTTVEFGLPAFASLPSPAVEEELPEGSSGARLRILLVEDHEPTAFVLARLLRRRGHTVRTAARVSEAIAADNQPIDLLVSDIGLPDGSGIDVIRHYRTVQSGFQAIALSGFGMEGDVERSLHAGFDRHLTKPVDFQTLQRTISELCESSANAR